MMLISVLLAQAAGPDPMMNVFFIVAIVFVFYFFMIRPQSRRAKTQREFLDNLQKGDRVITIGGIHGRIAKLNDNTVLLEVDTNGTKLKVERSVISMEFTNAYHTSENSVEESRDNVKAS
ncbi:MAG: preprotein translocase subunit YajC [Chitinophagales bacterium]